jgi:uncharacterized caspase-like protein
VRGLHFVDDRTLLVSAVRGLWRVDADAPGAKPVEIGARVAVGASALSPDRRDLAVYRGWKVELLDARSGTAKWSTSAVDRGMGAFLAFDEAGSQVLLSTLEHRMTAGRIQEIPSIRIYDRASGTLQATHEVGTVGPMVVAGGQILIGGRAPAFVDAASGAVKKRLALPDPKITAVVRHPRLPGFALVAGNTGSTSLVSLASGRVLAILRATSNGEYVTATPEGYYRASLDGARSVAWRFDCPLEAFPFSQFSAGLDRPEVVRDALAGKPPADAAAFERPPYIRLQSPPTTSATDSVEIPLAVWAPEQVKSLQAFVNGRAATRMDVGRRRARLSLEVPLLPGRNRVSVVAYDQAGTPSNPRAIDVESTAAGTFRPDLWVVAVGVSRYPRLAPSQQLEVADDDARAIAKLLAEQAGPGKAYARAHVTTLIDGQATVESVTGAIEKLATMRPDDLGVLFFAGHGVKLADGKSVLLTSQASLATAADKQSSVGWAQMNRALAKAKGRVVVLLDACHSGHLSTEQVASNEKLAQELSEGRRATMVVFAAARGRQLSYEVSAGRLASTRGLELAWAGQRPPAQPSAARGHGLFTAALIEALSGKASDIDKSGAIESSEVIAYVTDRVRGLSNGMQTPWLVRQEMFGDFALGGAGR